VSESEREREREGKRARGREREILRALLGRKPFWGSVLLINEPPESVYVLVLCRRE